MRARLGASHLVTRCEVLVRCSGVWWTVLAGSPALGFLLAPVLPITWGPPKTGMNSGLRAESRYWRSLPGSLSMQGPSLQGVWAADLGLVGARDILVAYTFPMNPAQVV